VQRGGGGTAVEHVDGVGTDEAGMLDPAGFGDLHQVAPQGTDVVGEAGRLGRRVQPADQPPVLGGHAGGAGVGVTLLRLDAADRQHRLPGNVHHVAAERERDDGVVRQAQLAAADKGDPLVQPVFGEDPVDPGEPELERQGDGVGEDQRGGAGAALARPTSGKFRRMA